MFAGGDAAIFETDGSGVLQQTTIPGPEGDLASYAGAPAVGTTTSYLYYSGHGDWAAEADQSGARTAAYTYDPFGAPLQTPPVNTTVERWTGRWDKKLDTTSGLVEMGVRPYDPDLGRFLAVDPVEGGSLNTYDYAGQDPINSYDLDGRQYMKEPGAGLALPMPNDYARLGRAVGGAVALGTLVYVSDRLIARDKIHRAKNRWERQQSKRQELQWNAFHYLLEQARTNPRLKKWWTPSGRCRTRACRVFVAFLVVDVFVVGLCKYRDRIRSC